MTTKPTLLLLSGLLCDDALWAHQIKSLSDVAQVHVVDVTGFESMSDLAQGVLDAAPPTFALAGLSMGGYVAQEIMRRSPQRVERLALLDTNARADLPEQSKRRRALMAEATEGDFKAIALRLLPALVHPDHLALSDTVQGMAERVGLVGFLNQQTAIMNRIDGRVSLQAVTCPTLVLCGADDQLTPVAVHTEMTDAIGIHAIQMSVPHCGHLSPLEQPEAVSNALRQWLLKD